MSENQVVGIVEELFNSGKNGGSSMRVNGMKIGVYDHSTLDDISVGDNVSFRWKQGKEISPGVFYKNLNGLVTKVSGGVQGSASPVEKSMTVANDDRQRSIIRQNSLTNAVNHISDSKATPEEVIALARRFEAYSSGDLDREAKERLANNTVEE